MNANQVEKIRAQYQEKKVTKLDELKALDKKVKRPATVFACVFGTIAALLLGFGMCLAMKVLGDAMALGIVIGIAGIALCLLTHPIYKTVLKARKKKYADEILSISDNILNQ